MTAKTDRVGLRYARLVVVGPAPSIGGRAAWNVMCDCGNRLVVLGKSLASGNTRSCGCLNLDSFLSVVTKHGLREHALYGTWKTMIQRCTNPKVKQYKDYGGRGIAVCKAWRDSFAKFLEDMGEKPSPQHALERRNNDKGYGPSNCYWATRKEQAANKRRKGTL